MREWLIAKRKAVDLTQQEVAVKSDISQAYYSRIEHGQHEIPPATAKKIANVLGFNWTKFYEAS